LSRAVREAGGTPGIRIEDSAMTNTIRLNLKCWASSRFRIVVLLAALTLALTLVVGPTAIFALAPFAVLLACPLMHVFMRHGHGQHGDARSEQLGRE
jgi:hypothetical protein